MGDSVSAVSISLYLGIIPVTDEFKPNTFILEGRTPVPCDITNWAKRFEDKKLRQIANTEFGDYIRISTVFLGLDHNFDGSGPPILFETMIFGSSLNEQQWRYATYEEAEKGHEAAVERVYHEMQGIKHD